MFKADGVEATTGNVVIQDIDPIAFKQLLRFLYTDECEDGAMEAMAEHLYVAAGKYQIERLEIMSGLHLCQTRTVGWMYDCVYYYTSKLTLTPWFANGRWCGSQVANAVWRHPARARKGREKSSPAAEGPARSRPRGPSRGAPRAQRANL